MQIIEHSVIGTRSAVVRLKKRGTELQFVLFPMIHIADPEFYRAVRRRVKQCDFLVYEGVRGRSALMWALTMTYRIAPANRRSGLIVDDTRYDDLGVPAMNPDATAGDISVGWRAMPLRMRLLILSILPVVAVLQLVGGRRRLLAPDMEVNDRPSARDEELLDNATAERFDALLTGDRDTALVAALAKIVRDRGTERIDVAVTYGAAHVSAIVDGLSLLGFRPYSGDWLTVIQA